jgi:hypothetical protein
VAGLENVSSACVSYSLYGSHGIYVEGILLSIRSYQLQFPAIRVICFVGDQVPDATLASLNDLGVMVVRMAGKPEDASAMLWRYDAPLHVTCDYYLFRDADSRASDRERLVLSQWIESGKVFLIIRDHPHHVQLIMGGLFSMRGKSLSMVSFLDLIRSDDIVSYGLDQRILERLYPKIIAQSMVFDSCLIREQGRVVKPVHDSSYSFMGERVYPSGEPEAAPRRVLRSFKTNPLFRCVWLARDSILWTSRKRYRR